MVDEDGRIIEGRRYRHDERGITALCRRLVAPRGGAGRDRAAGRAVDRAAAGRGPAGDRDPPQPGRGDATPVLLPPAARATALTASCWPSSRGPTVTATGCWFPIAIRPRRCGRSRAPVRTSSERGLRSRTSCAPSFSASGPALRACSRRSTARSRSRSSSAIPRPPRPAASVNSGMAQFLARHSYSGRKSPRELLGRLHSAAQGRAEALETEARRQIVLALIAALEPIVAKIARAHQRDPRRARRASTTAPHSARCSKTPSRRSPPRRCSPRSATAASATPPSKPSSADGGQSPVAVESGKSKRARFRWACDHRLRNAIGTLADTSRHHNPWAADIYQRAIARGATHPHAIRILGRAWCGVIWRLWQDHDTYDPNRHTALQRLTRHHRDHLTTVGDPRSPTSLPHSDGGRRRHRRLPAGQEREALDGKTDVATTPPRISNFRSGLTQEVWSGHPRRRRCAAATGVEQSRLHRVRNPRFPD